MSASASTATTSTRTGLELCGFQNNSDTFMYDSNGFLVPPQKKIYFDDGSYSAGFHCEVEKTDTQYLYGIGISEEDPWTVNRVGGPVSFTYKVVDGKTIITDVDSETFHGRDGYLLRLGSYIDLLFYDEQIREQAYQVYLKKREQAYQDGLELDD